MMWRSGPRRGRWLARLIWPALASLLLIGAHAQAQAPSEDDAKAQARAHFIEGREQFTAGQFAQALQSFKRAHEILPTPLMLSNISQVYESMDDLPRAIEAQESFIATGQADNDAKSRLDRLKTELSSWPQITLTSQPSGARVHVTSLAYPARCEQTPCTIALPPDRRTLYFELSGYQPLERAVRFTRGQTLEFPTVALAPVLGTVRLQTDPPGAQVVIGGGSPGVTPLTQSLPVGEHTAQIQLEGHLPVELSFTLTAEHTAGAPLQLTQPLQAGSTQASLSLTVNLPEAEIFIDGRPRGRSPLAAPLKLSPGAHQLRVLSRDAHPYEITIHLKEGEKVERHIQLDEKGGLLSQRNLSYGLMGLGAASLIGAGITGGLTLSSDGDLDDCRSDRSCQRTQREVSLSDDVKSYALTTDILLGAGVALAATGVVLFLLDDGAPAQAQGNVEAARGFGITPTQGGAAASAWMQF